MDIDEGSKLWTEPMSPGEQDTDTDTNWNEAFKKGLWCEEQVIYMNNTWQFLSHIPDV